MARRGDRASMREGPLAALFRKTDEGEGEEKPSAQPLLRGGHALIP